MTTTVVITSHPVSPNQSVSVTRYDADSAAGADTWVLERGAVLSTCISGKQVLNIEETSAVIVEAYNA